MTKLLSLTLITFSAMFLVVLGIATFFAPAKAVAFLKLFASSARAHYYEMLIRLFIGTAIILAAPHMLYSTAFYILGWVVVATSIMLLILPWRWHQQFADYVLPSLIKHVWIFGVLSLPLGIFILFAIFYSGGT